MKWITYSKYMYVVYICKYALGPIRVDDRWSNKYNKNWRSLTHTHRNTLFNIVSLFLAQPQRKALAQRQLTMPGADESQHTAYTFKLHAFKLFRSLAVPKIWLRDSWARTFIQTKTLSSIKHDWNRTERAGSQQTTTLFIKIVWQSTAAAKAAAFATMDSE